MNLPVCCVRMVCWELIQNPEVFHYSETCRISFSIQTLMRIQEPLETRLNPQKYSNWLAWSLQFISKVPKIYLTLRLENFPHRHCCRKRTNISISYYWNYLKFPHLFILLSPPQLPPVSQNLKSCFHFLKFLKKYKFVKRNISF